MEHFIFSQHQQPTEIKSEEAQKQRDRQHELHGQQQEECEAGTGWGADRRLKYSINVENANWLSKWIVQFYSGSFHIKKAKKSDENIPRLFIDHLVHKTLCDKRKKIKVCEIQLETTKNQCQISLFLLLSRLFILYVTNVVSSIEWRRNSFVKYIL